MDSLSQIVLGGAVAAAIVPAGHRRAALLAGAGLGTLPDLDALVLALLNVDPVSLMTMHRSCSHSLFVLPFVAWLVWWLCKRRGGRVAESPVRWFFAILLALVTHPLLDAFTIYGTQLWWPLRPHPTMWGSVFIVDPLYTVWLLLGCVVAWFARARRIGEYALVTGLALSCGYLGWSLVAKHRIDQITESELAARGIPDAPYFSVPLPLNTLLWRVVVMVPDGYLIGDRSLAADRGAMRFKRCESDGRALAEAGDIPAVRNLNWFNRGFMRARVNPQGELVLSDLRMGLEPDYNFSFAVAERSDAGWREIPVRQLQEGYRAPVEKGRMGAALAALWHRIWNTSDEMLLDRDSSGSDIGD
ncbi:MAG: metal-dependent hydrolase [Xanthomonadaceae bacterium]|jgi:inner membrane protein|nr:metal-dependent hydrolase [Xanthomonadaceae bacterium]